MGFQSVQFYGFRNLVDAEVNLEAHDVYLIGENGQGKTNFLEALYLLSYGSSFRTRQDRDMLCNDKREMAVHGKYNIPEEPEGRLSVSWLDGNKEIRLHGKVINDRKELLRRIPSIVFVHDDFLFAGGPPERRRWFMDQTLSLHDPLFVDQLRRYRQLLKERNHILKTRRLDMLGHYSEQLAFRRTWLFPRRRESLSREFGIIFSPLFQDVSGVPVTSHTVVSSFLGPGRYRFPGNGYSQ